MMDDAHISNLLMSLIGVLLAIIGFCVVWILNGIKEEIRGVKTDVQTLAGDLREDINVIHAKVNRHDASLASLQARCELLHEQSKDRA